jgi:hypothetical protein
MHASERAPHACGVRWLLIQDDQVSGAMARKHGFRFGRRDIFAGRLRVTQGQRWRIANFEPLPSPRLGLGGR